MLQILVKSSSSFSPVTYICCKFILIFKKFYVFLCKEKDLLKDLIVSKPKLTCRSIINTCFLFEQCFTIVFFQHIGAGFIIVPLLGLVELIAIAKAFCKYPFYHKHENSFFCEPVIHS